MLREEGRNRWVWNQATAARRAGLPRFDDKALTAARREHDWLRKGSVVAQQQTLRDFYSQKATGTVATISSRKMRAAAPAALERLLEEAAEIMLNMTVPSRSV